MKIIFIGGPGSGKSTIGKRLAGDLSWPWISSGEILRESKEPWVVERLKTAQLFDDNMVSELVFSRIDGVLDAILDGFPRTLKQAEMLIDHGVKPELIVEVTVPIEEAIIRLQSRGRDQDTPEIVEERWGDYEATKTEIVAYLVGNGTKLVTLDGVGTQEEVYRRAVNQIREAMKELKS